VLSVIIPTRNRAALLRESLGSLVRQTIARTDFEVIVIDDGSTDRTAGACAEFAAQLDLKYWRITPSGIAAAKNLGIFTASRPILLFFDDDDLADRELCREHLEAHARHPKISTAILGYTDWAPSLKVTPLMHFLTEVGQFLFSYPSMRDGQTLDWTAFWGGRTSCKRDFLVRHGVFNQDFIFGYEDDELGYRLSRHGLQVLFNRRAVQHMNRPITFDEFCRRCEREGHSQWRFSRRHPEPFIRQYCQIDDAERRWQEAEPLMAEKIQRIRDLEGRLEESKKRGKQQERLRVELMKLYDWSFRAYKLKGVVEAINGQMPSFSAKVSRVSSEVTSIRGRARRRS
jgi:glycosyltransferase involved in cell wall biosynthesis